MSYTNNKNALTYAFALGFVFATVAVGAQPAFAQSSAATLDTSSSASSSSLSTAPTGSAASLGLSESGSSETSRSKILQNFKFEDTSGLTDTRLRAEQGSMSRFSGKFNLGYRGPIIDDMSNPYQPNPDGSITHNPTSLSGNMAMRYRRTSDSAINFGTGISDLTPFSEGSRTQVSTPFVSIDSSFRAESYQIRESLGASVTTDVTGRNIGQVGGMNGGFSVLHNIGHSRWEIGGDVNGNYSFFGRGYRACPQGYNPNGGWNRDDHAGHTGGHKHAGASSLAEAPRTGVGNLSNICDGGNTSQMGFGAGPSLKYQASDKMGAFTGFNIEWSEPRASYGQLWLWERTVSQRLGVDYAFTKTIYFSPFVSFYPSDLSLNSTTINFSTIFSVF